MRKADWGYLAVLALLPLLLLAPYLLGFQVLYYRDVTLTYEPELAFIRHSLWSGQLPLWNPLLAGGYPQWASMEPAGLYPLDCLFFYLEFPRALALMFLLHQALAGWGTYALGRLLGWRRPAALLAALSFSLGGETVSMIGAGFYAPMQIAGLLPLVQLTLQRLWRRATRRAWLGAAAVFALQTATNRPDFTVITLVFMTALAWHHGYLQPHGRYRPCLQLLGVALLAVLANAATVLPALEFLRHSNRAIGELTLPEAGQFSFPPLAFIQLAFPQFYGNREWNADWGRFFVGSPISGFSQFYPSLYAGMGAYLMAGFALRHGRRSRDRVLAGLLLLALLLATGRSGFLFAWVFRLPLFSQIRYPVKFMLIWAWGLSLLAGSGTDTWLRRARQGRAYFRGCLILAGLALLALLLLLATTPAWAPALSRLDWSAWTTGSPDLDLHRYLMHTFPALAPGILAGCLAPIMCLMMVAWLARQHSRDATERQPAGPPPARLALLLGVAAADLLLQGLPPLYAAAPGFFAGTPRVAQALARRATPGHLFRVHQLVYGSSQDLFRFLRWDPRRDISWEETLFRWYREILYPMTALGQELAVTETSRADLVGYPSIYMQLFQGQVFTGAAAPPPPPAVVTLAAQLNVKYLEIVDIPRPGQPPGVPAWVDARPDLRRVFRDDRAGVTLYENTRCLPRAYFAARAIPVPDAATAFRRVLAGRGNPPYPISVLQDARWAATVRLQAAGPGASQPGVRPRCDILAYRNQSVRIAAAAPAAGYVVLADNDYPGWIAEVDGEERPVLQANGAVRAVWVAAGAHEVVFRYRPWPWLGGALVSALALLVGLLLLLVPGG